MKTSGKIEKVEEWTTKANKPCYSVVIAGRSYAGWDKAPEWAKAGSDVTIDYETVNKGNLVFYNIKTIIAGEMPAVLTDDFPVLVLRFKGKEYSVELR
jgi:hypothetical protein